MRPRGNFSGAVGFVVNQLRLVAVSTYKYHFYTKTENSRQRGRMGKGVVLTTTLIEWPMFNPHPGHVVASLDKTLYDDYLCLVASNKQQIQWTRIRKKKHRNIGNS